MPTRAIVPQSIAKIKKVTLTPHFNLATLELSCEQSKTSFFGPCRSEDVKITFSENYYEPYLIVTGKYSLDYVKKHVLNIEVNEKIDRLYIAGKEIVSEPVDSERALFKIPAEQRAHVENEVVLILDKRRREVDGKTLPFSKTNFKNITGSGKWPKLDIPTKLQIDLLRAKIAMRPPDSASVEKEIWEITQRTILYLPMCRLMLENINSHEEATASMNRVTGDIDSITYKKNRRQLHTKLPNIVSLNAHATDNLKPPNIPSFIQEEIETFLESQSNVIPVISLEGIPESMLLGFPAEIGGEVFSVGDNVTAVVGDIAIASGSIVDKSLVVKGSIKIGDNCSAKGKIKALRHVIIGAETVIDGDIVAGGSVFIGTFSTVRGRIEAAGCVRINEGATVEKGLCCFADNLEYGKENLERLRAEVNELKAECAELNECLHLEVIAE